MLNKPMDWDQTEAFGEYEQIALGGHEMVIKKVELVNSSTGKPMLKISLDTASSDAQPNFFANKWRNDTRQNKTWGCVYNQLIYNDDGTTNRGFKTIIACAEESNDGYRVQWGEGFESSLTGKLVGGVFGREEFLNQQREKKMSTKLRFFRSIRTIREGVEIPEDKLLTVKAPSMAVSPMPFTAPGAPFQAPNIGQSYPDPAGFETMLEGQDLPF